MGLAYNVYLNSNKIFGCKHCKTHLADYNDIISRVSSPFSFLRMSFISGTWFLVLLSNPGCLFALQDFRGQHGKAFLFNTVVNITQSEAMERGMTTGKHVVRDIACRQCKETVGWKYDKAYDVNQKYKEGKYILEEELLCVVCWRRLHLLFQIPFERHLLLCFVLAGFQVVSGWEALSVDYYSWACWLFKSR